MRNFQRGSERRSGLCTVHYAFPVYCVRKADQTIQDQIGGFPDLLSFGRRRSFSKKIWFCGRPVSSQRNLIHRDARSKMKYSLYKNALKHKLISSCVEEGWGFMFKDCEKLINDMSKGAARAVNYQTHFLSNLISALVTSSTEFSRQLSSNN